MESSVKCRRSDELKVEQRPGVVGARFALLSPVESPKIRVNTIAITYQQQKDQQRRSKMSDQEKCNPQHSDPQKPATPEQKPIIQPNQPVQQKPVVPIAQPKSPHSEPEKHDQAQKKHA